MGKCAANYTGSTIEGVTYAWTLAFSINGVHSRQQEHEPEKKREEQEGVEDHAKGHPSGHNSELDELLHAFGGKHRYMPQARRYVKLHFRYSRNHDPPGFLSLIC